MVVVGGGGDVVVVGVFMFEGVCLLHIHSHILLCLP